MSVVNSNLRIYDDTGKIVSSKSLTNLVAGAGVFSWISDPRVIYDPKEDRFILVCFSGNLSTESTILVGFTQTNDPAGNWNFYTLNGNSFNDSTWSDYPIISISDKDLFITFNQVKDNVSWTIGFKQSVIWQIDKQNGYNGNPLQYTLWSDIKHNTTYNRNICPAKYQTAQMGNNMYFLTLRNVDLSNDSIFVCEITDSYSSGNAALVQRILTTPTPYGFPPNARQKANFNGTPNYLMTNDGRVLAAIVENDNVHFGANSVNTQFMNAGVYLGTIKNISSTNPTVSGDIFSSSTMEYGYPSMTQIGNELDHEILYTFSHCITDSFPGTSILYKNSLDEYSDIISVKDGASVINVLTDSNDRWGDYTNIQKKYNQPRRAYLSGSWGKGSGMNCWISIIDHLFPLAVAEVKKHNESIVYPNPVNENRFQTRFMMDKAAKTRFELFDMLGNQILLMLDTYVKQGENEYSFTTDKLAKGMYVFKISTPEKIIATHKIEVK